MKRPDDIPAQTWGDIVLAANVLSPAGPGPRSTDPATLGALILLYRAAVRDAVAFLSEHRG